MGTVTLTDKTTHPPVGAWVWGNQGIAHQLTRRHRHNGQYWLTLATDSGPVEMPLDRVAGWAEVPPSPTAEATDFSSATPAIVRREIPEPLTVGAQEVIDLILILLDCRNAGELAAVKEVYGAELIQMAWGILSQKERQQIHAIATTSDAGDELPTAYTLFQPGDRVTSLSELDPPNTTGIVAEVGELAGKVYLTVEQDDGTLSMAQADWWTASPLLPLPFQPGDHVRYLGEGWMGSQMRPLLSGKTLVVKSLQHTPTEGIWVTCYVPNGLDQTVPASNLKHFY
jgi:hypothetical protein